MYCLCVVRNVSFCLNSGVAAGSSRRRNALHGEVDVDVDGTSVTGKAFVFAEIEKSRADNWATG